MLRNPTYVRLLRWNTSDWVKDPTTHKRIRRARPESEWLQRQDESLRIIEQDLWDRVATRTRLTADSTVRLKCGGKSVHLMSGLMVCGHCGRNYVLDSAIHYRCPVSLTVTPATMRRGCGATRLRRCCSARSAMVCSTRSEWPARRNGWRLWTKARPTAPQRPVAHYVATPASCASPVLGYVPVPVRVTERRPPPPPFTYRNPDFAPLVVGLNVTLIAQVA
jgi:hypothetical protein